MVKPKLNGSLSSEQKQILINLAVIWSMRSELEIGQLLDNITCLDYEEQTLRDVNNEEFLERLSLQIGAFSSLKKHKNEKEDG